MAKLPLTVVVSPREQFSKARLSLESVFSSTPNSFELVYVDGNSPRGLSRWLERQAQERAFKLLRADRYLAGNEARNMALPYVDTDYIVFIDNDVIVAPGCLESLIACAEETGAAVCGPLYLEGDLNAMTIHTAGADLNIVKTNGRHFLHEKHHHSRSPLAVVKDQLSRGPIDLVEFHCLLARREVMIKVGPFDEDLLSFFDHIDFCLSMRELGEAVFFEPAATVTHLAPPPFESEDVFYFLLRWSDAWLRPSLEHFAKKRHFELSDEFVAAHLNYRDTHRRRLVRGLRDATRRWLGSRALAVSDAITDRLVFGTLIEHTSVRNLERERHSTDVIARP